MAMPFHLASAHTSFAELPKNQNCMVIRTRLHLHSCCGAQTGDSLWLVFRDEGLSLHALMYAPMVPRDADVGGPGGPRQRGSAGPASAILQPSAWWWQLRQGPGVRPRGFAAPNSNATRKP